MGSKELFVRPAGLLQLVLLACALTLKAQDIGVVSVYQYGNPANNKVVVFPLTGGATQVIPLGDQMPGGLAVTAEGVLAVSHRTGLPGTSSVSFYDLNTAPPTALGSVSLTSPCPVNGVEASPDSRFLLTRHLWCAAWLPSVVTTIDVAARQVIGSVSLSPIDAFDAIFLNSPARALLFGWSWWRTLAFDSNGAITAVGSPTYGTSWATQGAALAPGGQLALVTNSAGYVTVLGVDAGGSASEMAKISLGGFPHSVAISPDGTRAYVTNYSLKNVAVLAISGSTVSDTGARIPLPFSTYTGFGANGLAITEDGRKAYVGLTDWGTNNGVWLIDLTTNTVSPQPFVQTGGIPVEIRLASLTLPVGIDIKPGSYPNTINLSSAGTVPVAVLASPTFDVRSVDPLTVKFAGGPVALHGKDRPMAGFEDVNGDGLADLVLHFSTQALQLTPAETEAVLEGKTLAGRRIKGKDSVRILDK